MFRILSKGKYSWLLPLSWVYNCITRLRNYTYDFEFVPTYQSTIYSIGIGNLTVGGTGKTPHIEYLIRLLATQYRLATLSRGYGRKTQGFRQATATATPQQIGDEPMQIFAKWGDKVQVFVGEKRASALQQIEKLEPTIEIVLLDDVFQHRAVKPHLNILLTDYGRLFYQDWVLPAGLLREDKQGAKRADAVVVTKCPKEIDNSQKNQIADTIAKYTKPHTPIFFSTFKYGDIQPYFAKTVRNAHSKFWLVSGIAQPSLFEEDVKKLYEVAGHTIFGDHHTFTEADIKHLTAITHQYPILTTEKDFIKIKPILEQLSLTESLFFYLPIEVEFLENGFNEFVVSAVDNFKQQ